MKTRFFNLKFGEKFTHAGRILQKETALRAVSAFGPRVQVTVWPWTRVRIVSPESDPLLFLLARDAVRLEAEIAESFSVSSPFLDMLEPGKFPEKAGDGYDESRPGALPPWKPQDHMGNPGQTHFFGDGCFPPHDEGQLDAYKNGSK